MTARHERRVVLDRVRAAIDRAAAGHATVVLLRGVAGSGKSWLLDQSAATAVAAGALVLRTAGHPSEQHLPYAGLHRLLHPVTDELAELPGPQRAAVTAALALAVDAAPQQPFAAAAGVHTLLTRLAERGPVLVLVDDVHWLDPATAQILGFVARRLDADRVAVILTVRSATTPGNEEAAGADLGAAAADTIDLPPMDDAEARQVLADTHPDLDAAVVREVVRVAAGLPLALVEVPVDLSDAQRRGAEPLHEPLPVGPTLERVYGARLAELDGPTRDALLLIALESLDRGQLHAALGRLGTALSVLEPAERAGLVRINTDGVDFTHPLVASAVRRAATHAARGRAHSILADVLAADGDADRRAWHLHAIAEGPDAEVTDALAEAAARADARGAPLSAARAFAAAAERSPHPATARRHRTSAALASLRGGDPTAATRLLDRLVEEAGDPVERATAERARVLTRTWADASLPDRASLTATAARVADTSPPLARDLLVDLAFGTLVFGCSREAAEIAAEARSLAAGPPDLRTRLVDDLIGVMAGTPGAGAVTLAPWEEALADDELCDPGIPVAQAALVRCWLDDPAGSARLLERQRNALRRVGAVGTVGLVTGGLAAVQQRVGDWDGAVAEFEAAERLCRATALHAPLPHIDLRYAALLADRGDRDGCLARIDTATRTAGALPSIRHFAEIVRGTLALAEGRNDDAVDHLRRAGDHEAQHGLGRPDGYSTRAADLVEALWRARREDEAAEALVRLAERAHPSGQGSGWAQIARGRALLAAEQDLDAAFTAAVTRFREVDDPFGRARTELCWGERLRRARRKRDARVPLHAASTTFHRLGARPWADRADAELAACGERRQHRTGPTASLTPQELQVALAVARGASNPEVAAALYLSRRTVEYHLSAVYRKLGVRDRRELARRLQPGDPG